MITLRHFAAPLLALTAFAPLPTLACSVIDGYRVPTNVALAADAELIVLGRVIGAEAGEDLYDNVLLVEPITAFKGILPEDTLRLRGPMIPDLDQQERGFDMLSNPYEFESAHPLAYIGACIRYIFPRGTTALFFLKNSEEGWRPSGGPFSRWAEDVLTDDAPWLQLTRLYVEAAALSEDEGRARLIAARDEYAAQENDVVAQLMAADIDRQLAGPNTPWNTLMRREIYGDDEAMEEAGEAAEDSMGDMAETMEDETDR